MRLTALLPRAALAVACALPLAGCGALLANAGMDFSIAIEPAEITAAKGSKFEVTVTVSRPASLEVIPLPVVVTLHDGPDFLTAVDLEIPPGIDEDTMTFEVSGDAQIGETEKNLVRVRATNGVKTKEATFTVTVVDVP